MGQTIDVQPGQRFGRFTVIREGERRQVPSNKNRGIRMFWCRCDCGETKLVQLSNLRSGQATSCGCRQREAAVASNTARATHGLRKNPLYAIWTGMMQRCRDERQRCFANYGGRGIAVCPEWHDPARFITWIETNIGPRPAGTYPSGLPVYTIDRINNDGNYEPGNVRWATRSEQQHNKRPRPRRLTA